jgi:hypothetical protein
MVSADDDANHLAYTMPAPLVQHSGLGRISRQEAHPLHSLPQKLDGLSKRHCCSNLAGYNEPCRMGRSGSKSEELIDQTDFACWSGLAEDAVTAADHAHDLKALQGALLH